MFITIAPQRQNKKKKKLNFTYESRISTAPKNHLPSNLFHFPSPLPPFLKKEHLCIYEKPPHTSYQFFTSILRYIAICLCICNIKHISHLIIVLKPASPTPPTHPIPPWITTRNFFHDDFNPRLTCISTVNPRVFPEHRRNPTHQSLLFALKSSQPVYSATPPPPHIHSETISFSCLF